MNRLGTGAVAHTLRAGRRATIPGMNAALRRTLGWVAAVLLNLGAVMFVVGLIVPRTGEASILGVGIGLLLIGVAIGAVWMYANRSSGVR